MVLKTKPSPDPDMQAQGLLPTPCKIYLRYPLRMPQTTRDRQVLFIPPPPRKQEHSTQAGRRQKYTCMTLKWQNSESFLWPLWSNLCLSRHSHKDGPLQTLALCDPFRNAEVSPCLRTLHNETQSRQTDGLKDSLLLVTHSCPSRSSPSGSPCPRLLSSL